MPSIRLITKKTPFLFILTLLAGTLSGCFKEPVLTRINSINFIELQDSILTAKVGMSIFNPNRLGVTIKSQKADLLMKGIDIGRAHSKQGFKLDGKDTTFIVLDAEINLTALSSIFNVLLEQDTAALTVRGSYEIKAGLSSLMINKTVVSLMEMKKELTSMLKQQMGEQNIRVAEITPKSAGISRMSIKVKVRLENDFSFDYKIKRIALSIYADPERENLLGEWESTEPTYLTAKSQQHLEGFAEVNNFSLFSGLTSLFKNRMAYTEGSASIEIAGETFIIPIVQEIDISRGY